MDNKEFEKQLEKIKELKEVPLSVDEKIQKAFEKIEENKKQEKEIRKQNRKFNFSRVLSLAASFIVVIFLAGNGVAYAKGEPNIYSWILEKIGIANSIVNEEKDEYLQIYTGKDENNNVIWTYKTGIGIFSQIDEITTLEITNDRIYINEDGKIVVLNKENGKVLWENTKAENSIIGSHHLDEKQNLYIFTDTYPYGTLYIFDKNGKEKAAISHEFLGEYMIGEGPDFKKVNEKELLLECSTITHNGPESYDVIISLEDYSIKKVTKTED